MIQDDTILISQLRDGNREAGKVLYEKYHRKVFGIAWRYLNNEQDALDVVHETFIRVFSHIDSFHGQCKFYTWMYTIASNLCKDILRKKKRWRISEYHDGFRARPSLKGSEAGYGASTYNRTPQKNVLNAELSSRINDALQSLSEVHREVFCLCEFDELSYEEIALAIGCPIGTVMSRLHYARKKLQDQLKDFRE